MKKTDYQGVVAKIDLKHQLEDQLAKLGRVDNLKLQASNARKTISDNRSAIAGLEEYQKKSNSGMHDRELSMRRLNVEQEKTTLERLEKEINDHTTTTEDLQSQLAGLDITVSLDHLTEHQSLIQSVQSELDNFARLIVEQHRILSETGNHEDVITPLIRQRQELLADIAIGNGNAKDLDKLNGEIETLQKEQLQKSALDAWLTDQAKQTLLGLERRREPVQTEFNRLSSLTPVLLDFFVMGKIEQALHEYRALLAKIELKKAELVALDKLVSEIGQRGSSGLLPINALWTHIVNIDAQETLAKIKQDMVAQGVPL